MYGRTFYKLSKTNYNRPIMNSKAANKEVRLTKYQVYLTKGLQDSLCRYISDQFSPEDRVITAIIRRAIAEFLSKRGYYDIKDNKS